MYDIKYYHTKKWRETICHMVQSNQMTDVTLVCDDKKEIIAHQLVLSTFSTVFKSLLSNISPCSFQTNLVIHLQGINYKEMTSIIDFMYFGKTTFFRTNMKEFLQAAKHLGIEVIIKNLVEETDTSISIDLVEEGTIGKIKNYTEAIFSAEDNEKSQTKVYLQKRMPSEPVSLNEANDKESEGVEFEMEFKLVKADKENIKSKKANKKDKDPLALTTENKGYDYKKLQCLHCVLQFESSKDMKQHINKVHKGFKYQCNLCEYICKQPYQLKIHLEGPRHELDVLDPAYKEGLDFCKKQIEKLQNYKKPNYILKNIKF